MADDWGGGEVGDAVPFSFEGLDGRPEVTGSFPAPPSQRRVWALRTARVLLVVGIVASAVMAFVSSPASDGDNLGIEAVGGFPTNQDGDDDAAARNPAEAGSDKTGDSTDAEDGDDPEASSGSTAPDPSTLPDDAAPAGPKVTVDDERHDTATLSVTTPTTATSSTPGSDPDDRTATTGSDPADTNPTTPGSTPATDGTGTPTTASPPNPQTPSAPTPTATPTPNPTTGNPPTENPLTPPPPTRAPAPPAPPPTFAPAPPKPLARFDLDFGTADSPVKSGWVRVTPTTNSTLVSWSGAGTFATDRGALSGLNAVTRDLVYGSGTSVVRLNTGPGLFSVTMRMGDATHAHDTMNVRAEGTVIATGGTNAVGEFLYVAQNGFGAGSSSFQIQVTDDVLEIELSDSGGTNPHWVLNRISVQQLPAR